MIRNSLVAFLMLSFISPVTGLRNAIAQQPLDGDRAITDYQWADHKLIRTSSISMRHSDSGDGCFTYSCSKLLTGKMVTTLEKQLCSEAEYGHPPDCPNAGAKKSVSNQSK